MDGHRQKFIERLAQAVDGYKQAQHTDALDQLEAVILVAGEKAAEAYQRALDNPFKDVETATAETVSVIAGLEALLLDLRTRAGG